MSEKDQKELRFEEALTRLETTVEKLESGGLTLDQAIKAFEEGSRLRRFCEDKLKETERKVEMIIKKETQGRNASADADAEPEHLETSLFQGHDKA
jgi:exodeoxyribonuclease VII small subunit